MNDEGRIRPSPHSMTRASARFHIPLSSPYAPWCVMTNLALVPMAA
jgi:hypothetical protein